MSQSNIDSITETAEQVLRRAVLRAVAGDTLHGMEDHERDAAMEPYEQTVQDAMVMLRECIAQAAMEGANSVHRSLHAQPGVDHEMLDEAVEYAPREGNDNGAD